MDSLKGTLTPMKVLNGTLNGGIAYGTFNYNELENKPSVNGTELVGNVTIDIPTKTSDLDNDSGFITDADVPTKTSELDNDSGFITSADIPTKTSELDNDSGFITSEDIPTIPTSTSQLNNDSGFLTMLTTPVKSVNSQTGDVNLFIPNATSQLTNDAGFLTESSQKITDIEDDIDDLQGDISVLQGEIQNKPTNTTTNPFLKVKTTANITKEINANNYASILGSDINLAEPGYTPIGIVSMYNTQALNSYFSSFDCTSIAGSSTFAIVKNTSSNVITAIMNFKILFMRTTN